MGVWYGPRNDSRLDMFQDSLKEDRGAEPEDVCPWGEDEIEEERKAGTFPEDDCPLGEEDECPFLDQRQRKESVVAGLRSGPRGTPLPIRVEEKRENLLPHHTLEEELDMSRIVAPALITPEMAQAITELAAHESPRVEGEDSFDRNWKFIGHVADLKRVLLPLPAVDVSLYWVHVGNSEEEITGTGEQRTVSFTLVQDTRGILHQICTEESR